MSNATAPDCFNTNLQTFYKTYARHLRAAVEANPRGYHYPASEADQKASKITIGLSCGKADKDSAAIRATCKELGIPHTYKAIRAYFDADDQRRRTAMAAAGVQL